MENSRTTRSGLDLNWNWRYLAVTIIIVALLILIFSILVSQGPSRPSVGFQIPEGYHWSRQAVADENCIWTDGSWFLCGPTTLKH